MKRKSRFGGYMRLYSEFKYRAKREGHVSYLSFDEWLGLSLKNCHYCGSKPVQRISKGKCQPYTVWPKASGIDRVDNEKGYEMDNVVPACIQCNSMKGNRPLRKFFDMVRRIYKKHCK